MICKSLTNYAAAVLSKTNLRIELWRTLGGLNIPSIVNDKQYELLYKQDVSINSSLEIVFKEINFKFKEHTTYICVFNDPDLDLVIVPDWCKYVMIGASGSIFTLRCNSTKFDHLHEVIMPEVNIDKFDIIS